MHNSTYPDDHRVVRLEFGQKQVPADNLRLVEGAEATQHFNVTLGWDVGHCADWGVECSRRRAEGRMLLLLLPCVSGGEERCCSGCRDPGVTVRLNVASAAGFFFFFFLTRWTNLSPTS